MFKYKAQIICDRCGIDIYNESDNKKDLASIGELKEVAREQGWIADRYRCICKECRYRVKE